MAREPIDEFEVFLRIDARRLQGIEPCSDDEPDEEGDEDEDDEEEDDEAA